MPGRLSEVAPPDTLRELGKALEMRQPQVQILSPRSGEVLKDTQVSVRLQVRDLPLFKNEEFGLGPHLHVILDNQPYEAVYDISEPLVFNNLEPGTHTLRVFASRPWHESFKNEGAFAQTTFHIFTQTPDNHPDPAQPLLTYSRPKGSYGAEPIMLDFYLTNAPLHLVANEDANDEIPDWKIRCTINGESFTFDRWEPIYLKGLKPGRNWLQLELLDEKGKPLPNAFNNTVRLLTYEPGGTDTLSKLVRGELAIADVRGIVDPNYIPEPVVTEPTPEPTPEPTIEPAPESTPESASEPFVEPTPIPEAIEPATPEAPEPTPSLAPSPVPLAPPVQPSPAEPEQATEPQTSEQPSPEPIAPKLAPKPELPQPVEAPSASPAPSAAVEPEIVSPPALEVPVKKPIEEKEKVKEQLSEEVREQLQRGTVPTPETAPAAVEPAPVTPVPQPIEPPTVAPAPPTPKQPEPPKIQDLIDRTKDRAKDLFDRSKGWFDRVRQRTIPAAKPVEPVFAPGEVPTSVESPTQLPEPLKPSPVTPTPLNEAPSEAPVVRRSQPSAPESTPEPIERPAARPTPIAPPIKPSPTLNQYLEQHPDALAPTPPTLPEVLNAPTVDSAVPLQE
jgi:hypothetical protein